MKFLHAQSAYLELRAAAVDDDAAKAELLPCIADDMLIAFDDVRAAAAVALLARLGQISQVILFTHHDPIAARTDGQAGLAVQCLPALISADKLRVTANAVGRARHPRARLLRHEHAPRLAGPARKRCRATPSAGGRRSSVGGLGRRPAS
jgi:hypothetical protein